MIICIPVLFVSLVVIVGALSSFGGRSTEAATTSSRTIVSDNVGCSSKAATSRLVELSGDKRAFALYFIDPANGCRMLKGGTAVAMEDYGVLGISKIHVVGDPTSLWVVNEAIR